MIATRSADRTFAIFSYVDFHGGTIAGCSSPVNIAYGSKFIRKSQISHLFAHWDLQLSAHNDL
jgi:hypothetical protein